MNDVTYYPQLGKILPDGNLHIPATSRSSDGEVFDGHIEVNADDPQYAQWLLAIQSKDQYKRDMRDQEAAARERRRN